MDNCHDIAASQELLEQLDDALEQRAYRKVRELLAVLHPAEIAQLLESLPPKEREIAWEQLDEEQHTDVLSYADDEVRSVRLAQMEPEELVAAAEDLEPDDAVDLLQDLPEPRVDEVLRAMGQQQRARIEAVLAYPEDTAGGLMNLDVLTVRKDVDLETVIRYLRVHGEIPARTDRLFVVDRDDHYEGTLRLANLITLDPERGVEEVMETNRRGIPATLPEREVALLFEQRDLISAPVVDEEGRLLGRITVDDVMDVIREEGERSVMSMAGLDEEDDIFAPVLVTSRRRMLWLGVNLGTALLASWVIGLFEATIQEVVALAILMPIVASMGGIAGTQTLTIVIRGMALGSVGQSNAGWLLYRELMVGLINSLFWAIVIAVIATLWFESTKLGIVVGAALIINQIVAAVAGAIIPLALQRLSIDPALAGGVVLTTVTDVIGFMAFLGLGALFLVG